MDLLPNDIVRQRTLEIVESQLNTKKFTSRIESATKPGDNFIGILYRAEFRCEDDEKKNQDTKKVNMIIKVAPSDPFERQQGLAASAFQNEAVAYNDFLPAFMKFQESKGINLIEDGFFEVAPCYGTITDEGFETVFLKDLCVEGFEMHNRLDFITSDHVNMVMKILGKLHAISFAMKDQCPQHFEKYKSMKDPFHGRADSMQFGFYVALLKQAATTTLSPEKDQKYIEKFNKVFEPNKSLIDLLIEVTDGKAAEPYASVIHGDCWNNNFLYRHENGKLVGARLLDWQMSRYATPVYDLMYFIFLGTSQEMRKKHYTSFIDTYYHSFSSFLTRLGSSPDKVFPRRALDEQLMKFGRAGFVLGCMMMPLLTRPVDEPMDMNALKDAMIDPSMMQAAMADPSILIKAFFSERQMVAYSERVREVIIDICDLGYM